MSVLVVVVVVVVSMPGRLATVVSVEDVVMPSVGAAVPSVKDAVPSVDATKVLSVDASVVPSVDATDVPSVGVPVVPAAGTVVPVLLLSVSVLAVVVVVVSPPPAAAVPSVVVAPAAAGLELSAAPGVGSVDESVIATLVFGLATDPSFLICSGVFLLLQFGLFLGQGGRNDGRS